MPRATTPTPPPGRADPTPPSTPSANPTPSSNNPTMRVQRNTPVPSTPGSHHRRTSSVSRTPGTSPLTCSSSPSAFMRITVRTAKCSECDLRNKDTMLRCPGCTFQVCKPCQETREKAGRSLAHGNMLSPQVATPGASGSVVRRRPVGTVRSVEKEKDRGTEKGEVDVKEGGGVEEKGEIGETKGGKRTIKPASKPKAKSKSRVTEATPSDDSSDDDFAPDPASPTSNKRRRTEATSKTDGTSDLPSPFLKSTDNVKDSTRLSLGVSKFAEKPLGGMTTDELLAHYDVNTRANPYKAHLLSRYEPVVSNPVIEIPEVVKRGFKPRPTAEKIQRDIQDKVRERMGLPRSTAGTDARE